MTTERRTDGLPRNPSGPGADVSSVAPLAEEIAFYLDQLPDWRDHEGEHVLIHGRRAFGFYPDRDAALAEGYRQFGRVPFLVKRVEVDEAPRPLVGLIL